MNEVELIHALAATIEVATVVPGIEPLNMTMTLPSGPTTLKFSRTLPAASRASGAS